VLRSRPFKPKNNPKHAVSGRKTRNPRVARAAGAGVLIGLAIGGAKGSADAKKFYADYMKQAPSPANTTHAELLREKIGKTQAKIRAHRFAQGASIGGIGAGTLALAAGMHRQNKRSKRNTKKRRR